MDCAVRMLFGISSRDIGKVYSQHDLQGILHIYGLFWVCTAMFLQ